jgi:hypothetical protein
MPLQGREEHESLREPCDEGSADAASAAPMGMKIALAYLLDCFEDYFHKK